MKLEKELNKTVMNKGQKRFAKPNYGKLILEFIKSLPQVRGKRWEDKAKTLDIEYKLSKGRDRWELDYDWFGDKWCTISSDNVNGLEYNLYGVNNTDLNGNLKEIYTIIEANKEDIIKTFTVDNSAKKAQLKQQIEQLNKQLEELENEQEQV